MTDLTNLILDTNKNAFKQNHPLQSGVLTISGTNVAGLNTHIFSVVLNSQPDMIDVIFNGPTDTVHGLDPRPSAGWFKQGFIWVPTNNAGGGNPAKYELSTSLIGSLLTITAVYVQQFTAPEVMTATNFSYRVIDYSVL